MSRVLLLLFGWTLAGCLQRPAGAGPQAAGAEPPFGQIATRFAARLPSEHITHAALDDAVSSRAWTNYLASLDSERLFFLQSDLARLKDAEQKLDDQIENGSLEFAYQAFQILRSRARNRLEFARKRLDQPFDWSRKEAYRWKRTEAPWPRDEAEWDEIWTKKIKNEALLRLVARKSAAGTGGGKDGADGTGPQARPEEAILNGYRRFVEMLDEEGPEWIVEKYLSAFAHAYDPHSEYMSPATVEDFDIEMKLSLVGIGALLRSEDGAAKVMSIIPGSPAERDGRLLVGDRIIAVGEGEGQPVDIVHIPLSRAVRLIRGEKGTRVVLTVIPASDASGTTLKRVDLVRDEVRLDAQAARSRIRPVVGEDGVSRRFGIVTLPAFYAGMNNGSLFHQDFRSCTHDTAKILRQLSREKVAGLLLDLRNNGGGSLFEAVSMAGLFLRTGPVLQVQEGDGIRVLADRDPAIAFSGPMVLLVNRLSASASEIVAGALQDYGRALIVGDTRSHGKGTVQSVQNLGNDERLGALKVTTSVFYRISGGSTQLKGVASDIPIPSPFDCLDVGEDSLPNAMPWSAIRPASFSPVSGLASVVPELRLRSEERRRKDPRFETYSELVRRICELNQIVEIPLDLESRRKLAAAEKELSDLQSSLFPEYGEPREDQKESRPDLVMEEGLRILNDLASLQERGVKAVSAFVPAEKRGVGAVVSDILRYFTW